MPASHESPAGTASSVLLVEEYDALAAAITSALKKFAPNHRVRVVDSFGDAEASLAEMRPRLLIVDIDPPRAGAVEFLERIHAAHADVRVLAIASGVPADLNSERVGTNAIQFIDKPFELSEFGAAVQALLGPWTNASGESRGTLRDLSVRDLVPFQCLNLATGVLQLRTDDNRSGEIHFLDGQITHATTGKLTGAGALQQIMGWRRVRVGETERVVDGPRTIHGGWPQIVLEALRQAAVSVDKPERRPVPAPCPEPAKPAVKTGKKIVVIDDTEMLLIFVEDALTMADPNLQIVTAFTGSEGLRRAQVMMPDLVLLDYSLPDLRGDQVCERLLQTEATARIPVVMMSGHVSEMEAVARKYRNVVATIAKPFMSDALIALIKETLAKGRVPGERQAGNGNGKKSAKKNGAAAAKPPQEKTAPPVPPPPARPPAPPIQIPEPVETPKSIEPKPVEIPKQIEVPKPVVPQPPPVLPRPQPPIQPAAQLATANGSTVVLGLGMEVLAVQFTPRFEIGAIRARPTSSTLSLSHPSGAAQNLLAGFEIGPVELDASGRIHTMRVLPTRRPPVPVQVRNRFEINDVVLVNQAASVQLTGGQAAPMTLRLAAIFKVTGVELSDRFEVAQLVLQSAGGRVRVNLDPQSQGPDTEFETVGVRLDSSRRITEFFLGAVPPRG